MTIATDMMNLIEIIRDRSETKKSLRSVATLVIFLR